MRRAIKLGVVVPRFFPFLGGVETYTRQACSALAAKGVDVTVVTQTPRAAELPASDVDSGCVIERHPLPLGSSFDVPSASAVRAATRPNRFDVLWVHSYHTPLACLVAERATSPLVVTPHYHGTGHTTIRSALHKPYRLAGRRLLRASRRIVVVSTAEAELLVDTFPDEDVREKTVVVPIGVTEPAHGSPHPSRYPVVLTVARQEPYKRTDLLLRAAFELRGRGTPIRLVVVGDGPALDALRALADRLAMSGDVTFTGTVSDTALGRWWATAQVYASASEREAFGISLAQALVSGVPVVASRIGAHREVVGLAGRSAVAELVDGASPAAVVGYADAIERQLLFGRSRRAHRESCELPTESCELPTPDGMADRLLDVFTSVTDHRASPPRVAVGGRRD